MLLMNSPYVQRFIVKRRDNNHSTDELKSVADLDTWEYCLNGYAGCVWVNLHRCRRKQLRADAYRPILPVITVVVAWSTAHGTLRHICVMEHLDLYVSWNN